MKLGKLSLVAVMALGTSAFAIDNVKVNGEAKLWYQTTETDGTSTAATTNGLDFFEDGINSSAEIKLSVGATANLLENLSGAVKLTALTTLGLENNLVGAVPAAKNNADGTSAGAAQLDDQAWMEIANLKYATKEFDVAAGRMALQTPLCFTETWNVVDNTFEAIVAHGYFLPDTILAAAWVGKHNGVGLLTPGAGGRNTTVAYDGKFSTFASEGAYAAAIINKSVKDTTFQAWGYNVGNVADAYWLQADTKLFGMLSLGGQFAGMMTDSTSTILGTAAANHRDTEMFALKAAVDVAEFNLYAAYSQVSAGTLGFANVATGDKTMMYTGLASVYFDGEIVSAPDTQAWKIGASTKMIPGVALAVSYGEAETGNNGGVAAPVAGASVRNNDYSAWDITANTKTGPVDWTAIFTQYTRDPANAATTTATIDNSLFRVIASLKF